MPPLSCPHGDVSWMSQNWPSAELTRVTAAVRRVVAATSRATHTVVAIATRRARMLIRTLPEPPGERSAAARRYNRDVTLDAPLRIGISACLLGDEVRYDGGHKRDAFLPGGAGPFVGGVKGGPEAGMGMGTP